MLLKVKKSENDVILQRQIQTSCNYNSLAEHGYFLLDHNVFRHVALLLNLWVFFSILPLKIMTKLDRT